MKGLSDRPDKPVAKIVPPKVVAPQPYAEADDQETVERIRRQEELDQRNVAKANRVAQVLDQSYYITDWTCPQLCIDGRQTSVSEYYPQAKIAIDKFYHVGDWEKTLTDAKRAALKPLGIRYAFLTPDKNLADIEADLEG